jgi:hypothetical protein
MKGQNVSPTLKYRGGKVMNKRYEKDVLIAELREYNKRLEYADRYDNVGDKMWYAELIARTEADLERLDRAK